MTLESLTERSTLRVSSPRLGLVVGKKPVPWTRHPVADLALEVAGVDGGPDLRRSRFDSNSWMRPTSNSSTPDLYEERKSVLSIANVSNSKGVRLHRFNVVFRQSLYRLRSHLYPWISVISMLSHYRLHHSCIYLTPPDSYRSYVTQSICFCYCVSFQQSFRYSPSHYSPG